AFTINELDDDTRARFLDQFLKTAERGAPVLVVEPIARRFATWWRHWAAAFTARGGREDEWRFRPEMPENLRLMDKAAGLDHREITGKSLWMAGSAVRKTW